MGTLGDFVEDTVSDSGIPLAGTVGSVLGGFVDSAFGDGADDNQFAEQFKEALGQVQNQEYIRAVKVLCPAKEAGTSSVWVEPYSIYQFRDKWEQNVGRVRALVPNMSDDETFALMRYGSYDSNFGWVAPTTVVQDKNGNPINGTGNGGHKDLQPSFWDKMPWRRWATMETWEKACWIGGGLLAVAGLVWAGIRMFGKKRSRPSTR